MKKALLTFLAAAGCLVSQAQTNTFPSTGNVGIGTTAPATLLSLSQTTNDDGNLIIADFNKVIGAHGGSVGIKIGNSTVVSTFLQTNSLYTNTGVQYGTFGDSNFINSVADVSTREGNINFITAGANRMTIGGGNQAGNVGIGTTTPAHLLHVNGNVGSNDMLELFNSDATDGRSTILFGSAKGSQNWEFGENIGGGAGIFGLRDRTASGLPVRFVVNTAGNMGIGTTSPIENLTLSNSTSTTGNVSSSLRTLNPTNSGSIRSIWTQDATTGALSLVVDQGQNGSARAFNLSVGATPNALYVNGSGNVGIGTTSPTYLLSVGGSATAVNSGQSSVLYYPSATSGAVAGVVSQNVASPTANSGAVYYGVFGEAGDGSISYNLTHAYGLIGVSGRVVHRGTGVITGSTALYSGSPVITGTGTISTAYGLYINSMKVTGVTNGFGIYQASATDNNYFAGNVAIGTTNPQGYLLAVNGSAIATSMTVKLNANWPDYVFDKDYKLSSLHDVKNYIDQNHHLPEMPSQEEVAKNGLNLGEINKQLTKKVEELTLYLIEKDKEIQEQKLELQKITQQQQKVLQALEERVKLLDRAVNSTQKNTEGH